MVDLLVDDGPHGRSDSPSARWLLPLASWYSLRRWLLLGFLLWIATSVVLLLDAKSHLDSARVRIDRAVPAVKEGELEDVRDELGFGAADLRRARNDLSSPVLLPLRLVPVVGRQLHTARSLSDLGADAATEAETLLQLVDSPDRSGAASLQSLDLAAIQVSVERIHELVATADLGPSEGLVGPLADARTEIAGMIEEYEPSLNDAAIVAAGLRSFKDESRYIILGANNAEMQVGGGMILSVGEVALTDDGVEFTGLESTEELFPVPKTPIVDPDIEQRWGFLQPTNDFRKLGVTPRFGAFVGPQAVAMWRAETQQKVDGAVLVDAHALSRLLGVIGTVEIDGETYSEETLLDYLLKDQYAAYGSSEAEQALRRAKLSRVTSGVLEALIAGPHDLAKLVEVIPSLIRGRNLLVFGEREVEQRAWETLGADGGSSGNDLGVFVANFGASKLDPYIDVAVAATTTQRQQATVVDLTVTIRNNVSQGDQLPLYVVGPWEWIELVEPGEYLGRLVVELPGATSEAGFVSAVPLEVFGPDGEGVLLGTRFRVRPGQSISIRLSFEVSAGLESVSLLPSARPRPVEWQWDESYFDDGERSDRLIRTN